MVGVWHEVPLVLFLLVGRQLHTRALGWWLMPGDTHLLGGGPMTGGMLSHGC